MDQLKKEDPEIYSLIEKEKTRQKEGLEMIPSENYASAAVLEAMGSILNDKYAEGVPGRRYYGGNVVIDEVERLCEKRALEVFGAHGYHVNVQPYSGSPANIAVYMGLLELGDKIMSLKLAHGGHLTHGDPVSLSGRAFKFVHYEVDPKTEMLDYDEIEKMAQREKPKLIVSGFTAYPRQVDFERMAKIAKSVGALSIADISHISGLVIGGVHPSPFASAKGEGSPLTDVVTTTTHKTLRGPRAAMIFCREEFKEKIDKAVFPGLQGGPHEHTIAAVAVALKEAATPEFKKYAERIVKNARALASALGAGGIKLVSGGTDNHLILVNLLNFGPGRGIFVEKALEAAGITVNKNPIPGDPSPPWYPSGIRLGTPALTSRGMKGKEMEIIGKWIAEIIKMSAVEALPEDKTARAEAVRTFAAKLSENEVIKKLRLGIRNLAVKFPVPGME